MKKFFTLLWVASCLFSTAQPITNPYCDGIRYRDRIFTSVTSTSAVQYGQNTTYCGAAQNMLMEIYQPSGDVATKRPVLFVNYGGSFVGGGRTDGDVTSICKDFAKRGYVTCAIDYRLFGGCAFPDSAIMLDVVVKAVGDQKAAIRFMRQHADEYKIDTNFVFVSGISAGAILALHTAYIDSVGEVPSYVGNIITANGGIEGNTSSNYQYNSSIQGVWSMSGGLHKASWIDADDPLLIEIHETADPTVPYQNGFAQVAGINIVTIQGGFLLNQREAALAKPNVFFSIANNGHTAYLGKPAIMDSLSNEAARVFESILCGNPNPSYTASMPLNFNPNGIEDAGNRSSFSILPNPTNEDFLVNFSTLKRAYKVHISDALGRTIYLNENANADLHFSKDQFNNGIYSIQVITDGGVMSTKLLVIY